MEGYTALPCLTKLCAADFLLSMGDDDLGDIPVERQVNPVSSVYGQGRREGGCPPSLLWLHRL